MGQSQRWGPVKRVTFRLPSVVTAAVLGEGTAVHRRGVNGAGLDRPDVAGGRSMVRTRLLRFVLQLCVSTGLVAVPFAGIAAADWFSENFEIHGFATSKMYFRSSSLNYADDVFISSWRNELNLETSLKLYDSDDFKLGLYGVLRPTYDATMDIHTHTWGNRAGGGGFYEYPKEGRKFLWPELAKLFGKKNAKWDFEELKERLLYRQAIETARCLEEGVLEHVHDANIGSIFGIGFPAWAGGALQYVNHVGTKKFVKRAEELAKTVGPRFAPPKLLRDLAAKNKPLA